MEERASLQCSVVQDKKHGVGLSFQSWWEPLFAVTGSVTEAESCWVEQTYRNYAAAAAVVAPAGNVPDLSQMETWAVKSVHEAYRTSPHLAVELVMWKTFFQGSRVVGMGLWRMDKAC